MNNNRIKQIIKECIYNAINEGSPDKILYNKWFEAQQQLGADKMLDSIWNYLNSNQLEQIIGYLNDEYGLWDDVNEAAGHLYGHTDDGTPFTNSKETYRGVPGTVFISHGEWGDPEIWYKEHELNGVDVEDSLWNTFKEYCQDEEDKQSFKEDTGHDLVENEDCYEEWLQWMGTEWIASQLDDLCWAQDGNP